MHKFRRSYDFDYETGQLLELAGNPFECFGGGGKGGGCSQIGHAYYLSLAYAFCGTSEEVLGFKRAGTIEWSGSLTTSGNSFTAVTGKRPDPVPDDYDYDLESCPITYYNGSQVVANSILESFTGSPLAYTGTTYAVIGDRSATIIPQLYMKYALRSIISGGAATTGAYIGMNTTSVPQYQMKLRRTTVAPVLGVSRINDDVNPAHILYDILVTHLELDPGSLDTDTFAAAAAILITEGIGLSFAMTKNKSASDWIDEILRHIDGILYYSIFTGRYTLKLLRDDYDINTVPVISESNSYDLEVERKSWADTYNTFTFKYTNREAKGPTSLVMINTANKKTVGQTKAKTIEYMAVTEDSTMELIANRAIKKLSYPLASVKFKVSSIDFPTLQIGDVLNLTHATYGVADMPIRILSMGGDKEDSTIIEIEGTEDIYGISKAVDITGQANLSSGVVWAVGPMTTAAVAELPGELYTEGTILPMGEAPTGEVSYITCEEVNDNTPTNSVDISPYKHGTLDSTLSGTGQDYNLEDVNFSSTTSLDEHISTDEQWQRLQNVVIIDDEFMVYQDLLDNGGNSYTLTNVVRGAFGSVIVEHAATADVWLPGGNYNALNVSTTSQTIKFTGHNSKGSGASLDKVHTYTKLGITPYPASNLVASRNGNDITITWDTAVRRAGATYYDADTVLAGVDEGNYEGQWLVTWGVSDSVILDSPTFTNTEPSTTTYTITSTLAGNESNGVSINI